MTQPIMKVLWCLFMSGAAFSPGAIADNTQETITAAWYPWSPYQYVEEDQMTGLDHALVTAIFAESDIYVSYDIDELDTWSKNQADVLNGKKDITSGAFESEYRKQHYHLSKPYRYEANSFYIRHETRAKLDFYLVEELLNQLEIDDLKLGVVEGYTYASEEINDFIERHKESGSGLIIGAENENDNFNNLLNKNVDILISDRLVGAQIVWQRKLGGKLEEHSLKLPSKPIHLLIHRSSDPVTDVHYQRLLTKFNQGVDLLTAQGRIETTIAEYLFPVLINITVQRSWFYAVDIIGAIFFAFSGFLIAKENRYDLFGTMVVIALLVGGGGIARDLLVGRAPVIMRIPDYIYIILTMTLGAFCSVSCMTILDNALQPTKSALDPSATQQTQQER
ncbi:transporter substrate-binding domain-containing protein [Vibrio mexicanus]|uniref:transporter substrate-binding domain-containing protein n=1 Tax=Vibrio mexicanus TaxID=1004326 RepID=UPI00063C4AEB|nr:transporter substrate-binding domain-containing protein [Vibrio mexicanus]